MALGDNIEPPLAGLKSLQTTGVWHKALEKEHTAQVKEKSLLGHLLCWEVPEIPEISPLYKISSSKLTLIFESKPTSQKFQAGEIHSHFGDKEIILSFQKQQYGALTNGKGSFFVTLFLSSVHKWLGSDTGFLRFWEGSVCL